MSADVPEDYSRLKVLADRLGQVPRIAQRGRGDEPEAETLAHALVDIDRVCRTVTTELIPQLFDPAATDEQIEDTLTDLGVNFREFLYHLRDPQHFRYLPGCEEGNEEA